MKTHEVRTYKSAEDLPRDNQLAWKIAEVAADPVAVDGDVIVASRRREVLASVRPAGLATANQCGSAADLAAIS